MNEFGVCGALRSVLCGLLLWPVLHSAAQVIESAREIPVSYDVDVLVVGGTSGGVAAAVEAAKNGASVFLMSDRPYLGEDLCGNYRLWLEPGEMASTELGQALFPHVAPSGSLKPGSFSYEADLRSSAPHKDKGGNLLCDGKYGSARYESVQYDGDITLTLKLDDASDNTVVHLLAYQREGEFAVAKMAVSVSFDGKQWVPVQTIANTVVGDFMTEPLRLSCPLGKAAQWVQLKVKKTAMVERILLGEIIVDPGEASPEAASFSSTAWATPLHVKKVFDQALLDNGVSFLVGCYPTDVLETSDGKPAGVIMANRAGRQAIRAKVIVDASPRATAARLFGAEFTPYPSGPQEFIRVVVGGKPASAAAPVRNRNLGEGWGLQYDVTEYTLTIPMADGAVSSFANAEQIARDLTWQDGQVAASEYLFQVPPDHMIGQGGELGAFQPHNLNNVFVVGGCADISREAATQMSRPLDLIRVGLRIGAAAGKLAEGLATPVVARVAGNTLGGSLSVGDVQEFLLGTRSSGDGVLDRVSSPVRTLPVLGEYDVVVIGGGTAGAPAGIAAARQGAKTLVVEYLHGLGGIGTLGRIGKYWYGNPVGFTAEIDLAVGKKARFTRWDVEQKAEWYRKEFRKAGGDLWLRSMGNGAVVDNGTVKGVVVTTPFGRGVVLCHTVVDATGNADIAAAAGAECQFVQNDVFALQGTGLSAANPGRSYYNSDWSYLNDSDVVDRTRMQVVGRAKKYGDDFDICSLLASRERRRIIGDYTLMPTDEILGRTFSDTILKGTSNFDSHGYTIHPVFRFYFPEHKETLSTFVPYRCLLPKGLDGILVAGIGASYHRDALPIVRMQPDVQNQGYAAGTAAAISARDQIPARQIDVKALQQHLAEIGNIDPEVLVQTDVELDGVERLATAISSLNSGQDYATILGASTDQVIPLIRRQYIKNTNPQKKLQYAHLLGALGQSDGFDLLADAVASRSWDKGWSFVGMGAHGSGVSKMDSMIVALGQTKQPDVLDVIVAKLRDLSPDAEFSHFRACAVALETLGDERAVPVLVDTLNLPGFKDHEMLSLTDAVQKTNQDVRDNLSREGALRELLLARALYRCGDFQGMGQSILQRYAEDLRGVYSAHARSILLSPLTP